jgi:hypothetical protein
MQKKLTFSTIAAAGDEPPVQKKGRPFGTASS